MVDTLLSPIAIASHGIQLYSVQKQATQGMLSFRELFYEHSQNVIHMGFALNITVRSVLEGYALEKPSLQSLPRIALQMPLSSA